MNDAGELKLRAERKLGGMIPEQFPNGYGPGRGKKVSRDARPLSEVGITYSQSSRWQAVAAVPEDPGHNTAMTHRNSIN